MSFIEFFVAGLVHVQGRLGSVQVGFFRCAHDSINIRTIPLLLLQLWSRVVARTKTVKPPMAVVSLT